MASEWVIILKWTRKGIRHERLTRCASEPKNVTVQIKEVVQ